MCCSEMFDYLHFVQAAVRVLLFIAAGGAGFALTCAVLYWASKR